MTTWTIEHRAVSTAAVRIVSVASALLLLLVWLGAAPAAAHASLVGSEPVADAVYDQAPSEVVLTFDDTVDADLGGIQVFGPDGDRVDRGTTEVDAAGLVVSAPLEASTPGTYTVAWSVVSPDSHVISGSFVFHVQTRTGSVAPDLTTPAWVLLTGWLARWALLTGTTVLGGVALLRLVTGEDPAWQTTTAVRVVRAAAGLLVVGAVARLVVQVLESSTLPLGELAGALAPAVLDTRTGLLDLARVGAGLLAAGAVLRWGRRYAAVVAVVGVGLTMVTIAASGHAWTVEPTLPAVASDVVHQGAAAVWVGGLVSLALVVPVAAAGPGPIVRRFSQLALGSVVVLVVTGVLAGLAQSGARLDTLVSSRYGAVLMVKVALVALMVGLGWTQRRRLAGVIERPRFLATSRLEAVTGVAVLATTALLVSTVPARESLADRPFEGSVTVPSGSVSVLLTPGAPGANDLHLTFYDRVGAPRQVDVARATASGVDLPELQVELDPLAGSHWVATGTTLPSEGVWTFAVETAGAEGSEEFTFEVPIGDPP